MIRQNNFIPGLLRNHTIKILMSKDKRNKEYSTKGHRKWKIVKREELILIRGLYEQFKMCLLDPIFLHPFLARLSF